MESKIKIKLGPIEVEYEGSEKFLKQELPDLIKTVSELYKTANLKVQDDEAFIRTNNNDNEENVLQQSTNSIAAKLLVNSGSELVIAAAAHLTFVKKQEIFTRKELLKEMQTASSYYKSSYSANFSTTLSTLIKSKFNEPSTGKYALTANAKSELRPKLA